LKELDMRRAPFVLAAVMVVLAAGRQPGLIIKGSIFAGTSFMLFNDRIVRGAAGGGVSNTF
jgi:hypothetical protein